MSNPFEQISLKKRQIAFIVLIAAFVCLLGSVLNFGSDSSSAEESEVDYEHFYRDKLTDLDLQIYQGLDGATIENPKFTITVPESIGKTPDEVKAQLTPHIKTVFSLYKEENLYKYWMGLNYSLGYSYDSGGKIASETFTIELTDLMTEYGTTNSEVKANVAKINAVIDSYSAGIDTTSTFTKVQSIHSIVIGLLEYNHSASGTMVPRNIATAFLGGSFDDPASVVCEGYARAFKAICDVYDVPCIIVTGKGVTSSGSEGHMWNQVLIDGEWYVVDCTWDDQSDTVYSDFMLVGSQTTDTHFGKKMVSESHVIDSMYSSFGITLTENKYVHPSYEIRLKAEGKDCALLYYDSGQNITVPYTPVKASTPEHNYIFTGWECGTTLPQVTGKETYNATFAAEDRHYTVTLIGADGSIIDRNSDYLYNADLIIPSSLIDAEWETEPPAKVTADATYTAKVSTVISSSGTVVLTSVSNAAKVSSNVISAMQSHSGGTFILSTGTITFDEKAVKNLIADQTIQMNEKSFSSLSESARSQLGNAEVYEITFGDNDSVFSSGTATVTVPYKLASGQSAADVKMYSVDGDSLTQVECSYYDGKVTFSTGEFSCYAIQIPDNSSSIVNLIKDNVVIIAILIFAIIGIALSYKFSKP